MRFLNLGVSHETHVLHPRDVRETVGRTLGRCRGDRGVARTHGIQVLMNYQMAWWPSNYAASGRGTHIASRRTDRRGRLNQHAAWRVVQGGFEPGQAVAGAAARADPEPASRKKMRGSRLLPRERLLASHKLGRRVLRPTPPALPGARYRGPATTSLRRPACQASVQSAAVARVQQRAMTSFQSYAGDRNGNRAWRVCRAGYCPAVAFRHGRSTPRNSTLPLEPPQSKSPKVPRQTRLRKQEKERDEGRGPGQPHACPVHQVFV